MTVTLKISFNSVNSVNSANSVNSVNIYSAVLPPSPMVFFSYIGQRDRDKDMSRRKADNLVKKVAVCLTHRDQSDGKNMIDIEINLYRTNFYAWCSFCLDV